MTETEIETLTLREAVTRRFRSVLRSFVAALVVASLTTLVGACGTDRIEHTLLGSDAGDAAIHDVLADGRSNDARLDGIHAQPPDGDARPPDASNDLPTDASNDLSTHDGARGGPDDLQASGPPDLAAND